MREAIFQLCWVQHGGCGLGWTRSEALDLDVAELDWWLDRVGEQRGKEARAIDRAVKKR